MMSIRPVAGYGRSDDDPALLSAQVGLPLPVRFVRKPAMPGNERIVDRDSLSFRAMHPGNHGILGNVGNGESVSYRPHYPGGRTNPPLSAKLNDN
jgi:hypothetical protein